MRDACSIDGEIDIVPVTRLLGHPARARMLDALLDGRAHSAGELARRGGVAASTASSHLARLSAGGLVRVEPQGFARACLDWTESRPHLAGALGAAALAAFLEQGWVRRRPDDRALVVTPHGRERLPATLGLKLG